MTSVYRTNQNIAENGSQVKPTSFSEVIMHKGRPITRFWEKIDDAEKGKFLTREKGIVIGYSLDARNILKITHLEFNENPYHDGGYDTNLFRSGITEAVLKYASKNSAPINTNEENLRYVLENKVHLLEVLQDEINARPDLKVTLMGRLLRK